MWAFGSMKQFSMLQLPISYCVSLIMVTVTILWLPSTRELLFGFNLSGHCLVRVHMLQYLHVGAHITITQSYTHAMQQTHMHKAVTGRLKPKSYSLVEGNQSIAMFSFKSLKWNTICHLKQPGEKSGKIGPVSLNFQEHVETFCWHFWMSKFGRKLFFFFFLDEDYQTTFSAWLQASFCNFELGI